MGLIQSATKFAPYAGDTFGIVQGMFQIASAGDVGRAKKKLLDSRASYNRKQIEEALSQNYAKVLSNYATKRNDINMQRSAGSSLINTQSVANVGDIDISESSFRTTAYGQLDEEYARSMKSLEDANTQKLISLATDAINQEMKVNMAQSKGKLQIDAETEATKSEGWQKILKGAVGIGTTFFEQSKEEENNNQIAQNINGLTAQLQDPFQIYSSRINSRWTKATNKTYTRDELIRGNISFGGF